MLASILAFFEKLFTSIQKIFEALSKMAPMEAIPPVSAAIIPHKEEDLYGPLEVGLIPQQDTKPEIIIDRNVRTKYRDGWIKKVRAKPPEEIVLHGTAGGKSTAGLLHWMYNWGRSGYFKGISLFHYAIGRGEKEEKDGLIVEVIDPEYWVYHSTSGKHAKVEIGIELINSSKSNRDPYTDAQYESLFKLIFDHLLVLYPTITRITGHKYNIWKYNREKTAAKYDKNCPGNFEWDRLAQELEKREYTYETEDTQLHYNIAKKIYV